VPSDRTCCRRRAEGWGTPGFPELVAEDAFQNSGNSPPGPRIRRSVPTMASASERTEDEARVVLFVGGVNGDVPLTAKICSQYGPVVDCVRERSPDGSYKIAGYRLKFKFYPRGRMHAGKAAGFSRGDGKHNLMSLKHYQTATEAEARKYRDVIAFIESNCRIPKTKTPNEQQQQQQRADRKAARNSRNKSDAELAELSFAALTDYQVDKLYAQLEVVMVVCMIIIVIIIIILLLLLLLLLLLIMIIIIIIITIIIIIIIIIIILLLYYYYYYYYYYCIIIIIIIQVDVCGGLHDRLAGGDAGAAHDERHAYVLLVELALVPAQAELPRVVAMVGGVEDVGVVEYAGALQRSHHALETAAWHARCTHALTLHTRTHARTARTLHTRTYCTHAAQDIPPLEYRTITQ
jgi:hypothetical protein